MTLLFLLFLHHLGDAALQPGWMIESKKKHLYAFHEHVAIWTGVICLGFYALNMFEWWLVPWLYIGHFTMDCTKYHLVPDPKNYKWTYPDQAFHYLQIIIPYLWLS